MSALLNVLAFDASGDYCVVELLADGGKHIFRLQSDEPKSHAQTLLPMIDRALARSGKSVSDIDLLATTVGPGSFTGIRISTSVAQGLSYARDIPCLPLSSLQSMAYDFIDDSSTCLTEGELVLSMRDARMGELYWALYLYQGQHVASDGYEFPRLNQLLGDQLSPVSDFPLIFSSKISALFPELDGSSTQINVVADMSEEMSSDVSDSIVGDLDLNVVLTRRSQLMSCGAREYLLEKATEFSSDLDARLISHLSGELRSAHQLEPLYLRKEISWKKRQRIRSAEDELFRNR